MTSEKGNERRGFIEEPQYRKLADAAAGQLWLRGLLALGYTYGFRKAELLEMRCNQVDLLNNTVCLYSGETKNGEGRTVALTEECRIQLTELRKGKQPEDFVFTRDNGEPVRDFRGTWEALCCQLGLGRMIWVCAAKGCKGRIIEDQCEICSGHKRRQKYEGLIFHDQRRSAVCNMVRRGVPQKTAREISGHKTDSVFARYNITSEQDIRDAARKIEEGAKAAAAVAGSIHSSFIVEPKPDEEKKVKPFESVCGSGGTGRRARLRILWGNTRGGSNPLSRTNTDRLLRKSTDTRTESQLSLRPSGQVNPLSFYWLLPNDTCVSEH